MKKIKIVVVDDNEDFRNAFKMLLQIYGNVEIIGEASTGKEFLDLIDKVIPDIVFMDIEMPEMNGIEATAKAIKKYNRMVIIALSFHSDFKFTYDMILAGARNYLIKNNLTKEDIERVLEIEKVV